MIHKYYVSKTLIYYDQDTDAFEITTQIFIDDLELELHDLHNVYPRLMEKDQHEDADLWLEDYLIDKLVIEINGTHISQNYLGAELEGDILYCYMEIPNVHEINSLTIKNEILMLNFEDQKNIVDLQFPEWEKRIMLVKEKSTEIIL